MPNGVGLLSQVLGSTLEANRRNAMWRAEQEQQNELAAAQMQAQKENLASQLKAHLFGQLIADATKNVAMAQSYDRQEAADRARDARATNLEAWRLKRIEDMDKAREDRDAARLKGMMDLEELRGKNARDLKRVAPPPTTRYNISERRGDHWDRPGGAGSQFDVRKTPEWNQYASAVRDNSELERQYNSYGRIVGEPPPQELLDSRERKVLTQKYLDAKYPNASASAGSTVTTGPGMLALPADQQTTDGLFLRK